MMLLKNAKEYEMLGQEYNVLQNSLQKCRSHLFIIMGTIRKILLGIILQRTLQFQYCL